MGLALDEPKSDDEEVSRDGISFLFSPSVRQIVGDFGDVLVEYSRYLQGLQVTFSGGGGRC